MIIDQSLLWQKRDEHHLKIREDKHSMNQENSTRDAQLTYIMTKQINDNNNNIHAPAHNTHERKTNNYSW